MNYPNKLDTSSKNDATKARLAIALGDPAGIGPEVVLKALADSSIRENYQISLVGSRSLLEKTYHRLQKSSLQATDLANPDELDIINLPLDKKTVAQIELGTGNAASGEASFVWLQEAIARTLAGEFQGIVTAPIAKSCWKSAGYHYPGQTEVLAEKAGVEKFGMLFVARSPHSNWILRALLATTHIPLSRVSVALTPELMALKLDLLIDSLKKDFGIDKPKIAIAGLNPHSGEAGQLGSEEQDWFMPWLETERKNRPQVKLTGLVPPDTMWVKPGQAWYGAEMPLETADAYLALYHDQGLIPVKLMAFDRAINTTIGLPFVRTSPDHGTAFDIAGKGIAIATSMKEAIKLAAELAEVKFAFKSNQGNTALKTRHC
jgi:4-hydroxythreonine-4-phosphate dehydrogenase